MTLPAHRLVHTTVAAQWLQVSVHTVRRLVHNGTLTNHGDDRHYRLDMIEVDEHKEMRRG